MNDEGGRMEIGLSELFFFVLGILITIPLSVVGNMITPRVQDWWASRSAARRQVLEERRAAGRDWGRSWLRHPHSFQHRQHDQILILVLFGVGAIIGLLVGLANAVVFPGTLSTALLGVFSLIAAIVLWYVAREGVRALEMSAFVWQAELDDVEAEMERREAGRE